MKHLLLFLLTDGHKDLSQILVSLWVESVPQCSQWNSSAAANMVTEGWKLNIPSQSTTALWDTFEAYNEKPAVFNCQLLLGKLQLRINNVGRSPGTDINNYKCYGRSILAGPGGAAGGESAYLVPLVAKVVVQGC